MSSIDKQRISAVATLERLGWRFVGDTWVGPSASNLQMPADRLHHLVVMRADALAGCATGSPEADELDAIVEAIEDYEAMRWPDGVERQR